MKCTILHESRGRLRVHVCNVRMTLHRADVLEAYLNHHDAVSKAKVYERTGDVVVYYTGTRKDAVAALSTYRFDDPELDALVTSADSRRINQEYQEKMYNLLAGRVRASCSCPPRSTPPTPCSAPSSSSGRACAACGAANWKSRCWML